MRVGLAIALAALAGCTGSLGRSDRAITHGQNDDGDPAVAALLDGAGGPYCTGTLVTPEAVLTAAHCLDDAPPAAIFFGAVPGVGGETVGVVGVQKHPGYDPVTHANDVAVVLLAASPDIDPVPIYLQDFDASFTGKTIRLVGFGRTAMLDDSVARKRQGTSRIQKYSAGEFSFVPAPSQTCFGDSGGPAFGEVGGVDYLLGITSTGDPECLSGGTDVRVGAFESGFVAGYLSGAAPGATLVGGCSAAPGARAENGALGLAALLLAALAIARRRRAGRVGGAPDALWHRRHDRAGERARDVQPTVARGLLNREP